MKETNHKLADLMIVMLTHVPYLAAALSRFTIVSLGPIRVYVSMVYVCATRLRKCWDG